jgi:hypothetical protein
VVLFELAELPATVLVFVAPTRFRWWFVALVMSDEVLVVRLPHWRWIC